MKHIVLINPNTSAKTTAMMTGIARHYLPAGFFIEGMTAQRGAPMITDPEALAASENGVVEMGISQKNRAGGMIVSAFGDPGLQRLRMLLDVPVTGLCEASMLEAAEGGRRFGIATVTPQLADSFSIQAEKLRLGHAFVGNRLTCGDPEQLAADPERLRTALETAVRECFELDGAEAVIIGGGPLGQAAEVLQHRFSAPVIAPIRSAVRLLVAKMNAGDDAAAALMDPARS